MDCITADSNNDLRINDATPTFEGSVALTAPFVDKAKLRNVTIAIIQVSNSQELGSVTVGDLENNFGNGSLDDVASGTTANFNLELTLTTSLSSGSNTLRLEGSGGKNSNNEAVSENFLITLDTTVPSVDDILDVVPDPRESSVSTVDVDLSEMIDMSTFTAADVTLTRNSTPIPLVGVSVAQQSGSRYRISGLADLTAASGVYTLTVNGSGIRDAAENIGSGSASDTWTVNKTPTLDAISNLTLDEDALLQLVSLTGITAGAGESQPLSVTASSDNTGLISNPTVIYTSANSTGQLRFTPSTNSNGVATIQVAVEDGGPDGNLQTTSDNGTFSRTFDVTVNSVNDAPTLNSISDPTPIKEDAAQQTINLTGISAGFAETQDLTVTASSGNSSLIPNPTVTYTPNNSTGSLSYTPIGNQSGTAVITVTVTDNGGIANGGVNTFSRMFTVNVNSFTGTQIDLRVVTQPTSIAANGEAAVLPANAITLHEWEPFWAEIWVSTPDATSVQISSADVDLAYNTQLFTAIAVEFSPGFTANGDPVIDDTAGSITGFSGTVVGTGVADDQFALLGRVRFESRPGDQLPIDIVNQEIGPADLGLNLTTAQVGVPEIGIVLAQIGPLPTTEVFAVIYDIDDNGVVSFGDLAQFADPFGDQVTTSTSDFAWIADFDKSGVVGFGDLSFFADAFLRTQSDPGTLTFPDTYPNAWRGSALVVNSLQRPTGDNSPPGMNTQLSRAVAPVESSDGGDLDAETLLTFLSIARESFVLAGASDAVVRKLDDIDIQLVDLPVGFLGLTRGRRILIDLDAAGHGWYIDPIPHDDSEFGGLGKRPDGIDLLTVISHEFGHVLGLGHRSSEETRDSLMFPQLDVGIRKHLLSGDLDDLFSDSDFIPEVLDTE